MGTSEQKSISRRAFLINSALTGSVAAWGNASWPAGTFAAPAPTEAGWFDRPMRWAQLTLVENDPGQYDPQFWLDYFKRVHADAACLSAGGVVAYYPTKIPLHHRSQWMKETDPFGELLAGCRKLNMVVIARTDPHAVHQDVYEAHPDWIAVDAEGRKRRHWASPELWVTCALGPYNFELRKRRISTCPAWMEETANLPGVNPLEVSMSYKYYCEVASLAVAILLSACAAHGQTQNAPRSEVAGIPVNYDEAKVGSYTLPDPLTLANGKPVRDAKTWLQKRRPEIVRLFEENQFGRSPGKPAGMSFDVFDKGTTALDGKALRRQVTIYFSPNKTGPKMDLLVYLPANAREPVPLLLNLSFTANSNAVADPGIKPGEIWNREKKRVPAPKDGRFGSLKVLPFLEQGFGVATFYYGDVDPDFLGGIPHGVRALYLKPGQTEPAPNEWGAIGAWAWGASRALDYLETDKAVDSKRVAITGVSRLGKTVMWAGAHDPRFAMVIASCSGEGGAALSRRNYGETIKHLTEPTRYPYQFCANYGKYGDRVNQFPVDAHMLVSLIAPRPVLLQTGDTDVWSDPKGEFLAAVAAEPVFKLLGKQGLGTTQMPAAGQPIFHTLGYVMHAGGHGTIPSDWELFLKFMQTHLQ